MVMATSIHSADQPGVRQRNATISTSIASTDRSSSPSNTSKRTAASVKKEGAPRFSLVDGLRAIVGLLLVSTLCSYLVTLGESWTWGLREKKPWWLDWKAVSRSMSGPVNLTNTQLSAFSGIDPTKPIYVAINRTIYDVSASPHVYGPGGMYATLAAKDASRSFITTCFDPTDDLVPYLTGVEEIYVPLWLSTHPGQDELDAPLELEAGEGGTTAEAIEAAKKALNGRTAGEMIQQVKARVPKETFEKLQDDAYQKAKERVKQQIKTWEGMFERKAYPKVGSVVGVDENDGNWKKLRFCEAAKKQRPPMRESLSQAMAEMGVNGARHGSPRVDKPTEVKTKKERPARPPGTTKVPAPRR